MDGKVGLNARPPRLLTDRSRQMQHRELSLNQRTIRKRIKQAIQRLREAEKGFSMSPKTRNRQEKNGFWARNVRQGRIISPEWLIAGGTGDNLRAFSVRIETGETMLRTFLGGQLKAGLHRYRFGIGLLVVLCAAVTATHASGEPEAPVSIAGTWCGTFDHGEEQVEVTQKVPREFAGRDNWKGDCVVSFKPKVKSFPSRVECKGHLEPWNVVPNALRLKYEERWGKDPRTGGEYVLLLNCEHFGRKRDELKGFISLITPEESWVVKTAGVALEKQE